MKKIVFENVSKAFGDIKILENVSFELNDNDSMIILGKSGVGKSVTLKILLGLLSLDSGDIWVNGISVRDKSRREEYRSNFSVLFQGCALFDSMTVLENVMFCLINHGMKRSDAREIAVKQIMSVGLTEDVYNMYPSSLSGGMQKRVALARSIAVRPDIILFDEPTSGLDPVTGKKISLLIKSLLDDVNVTSLTITHDMGVAKRIGNKAIMLDNAKIAWSGDVKDMSSSDNPIVQDFVRSSLHE